MVRAAAGSSTANFKKIGKYNEKVAVQYALPYDPSTLAFIVFSTPAMFDRTFKPFIRRQPSDQLEEPIDQCMIHHFNLVKEAFPQGEVETLHDFEMTGTPQ